MLKQVLSLVFLSIVLPSLAQIEDESEPLPEVDFNHTKYLRDGIMLDADADVSLNLFALPIGYIEPHYEHRFSRKFSVDAYAGIHVFANPIVPTLLDIELSGPNTFKSGFRAGLNPRLYNGYGITRMGYWGLEFQIAVDNMEASRLTSSKLFINKGLKTIVLKSFSIHVSGYGGIWMYNHAYEDPALQGRNFNGSIPYAGVRMALGKYVKY
jgi:hypothetical protein